MPVCLSVQDIITEVSGADPAHPAGAKMSNNIYVIPGTSRTVSIRDAAYYCVGEVLSGIDGGRARIKDVIEEINKLFLEHNPLGWVTTNKQKRAEDTGGFKPLALLKIGKAAPPADPGRWVMKPTFCVAHDDELVLLGDGDSDNETV